MHSLGMALFVMIVKKWSWIKSKSMHSLENGNNKILLDFSSNFIRETSTIATKNIAVLGFTSTKLATKVGLRNKL